MIENKLNELNLIEIDDNSSLSEFRTRINKYTNAILNGDIPFEHFDDLLSDFNSIKSVILPEYLERAELIENIKDSIREELIKI